MMQLREFAERVLFSNSLEEKLTAAPANLLDDDPGPAIDAPGTPGRPSELILTKIKKRSGFPKPHQLANEEDRAILLHFFANHELLATELMALVLLKFPDAPKAFRKDILRTLQEEQAHTRMYMSRMAACDLAFGDLPVNGFFWNNIAPMESPLDYVTRLSLTFEQANLDYAKFYAGVFAEMGDASTAKLLDKIYRDEIGHVGYGLKWFRRWKEEGVADWDAYRKQLVFPLSPQRAKGKAPFNAEGRRLAGLDEHFIRELEVAVASRGRTPFVRFFNPSAEEWIGTPNFEPGKTARALATDLATLPIFLCREDDIVLTPGRPSTEFLHYLKDAGAYVPEFQELDDDGSIPADAPIRERRIGGLSPWAWSPDSVHVLQPLAENLPENARRATFWDPRFRDLYSKAWSADRLRELAGVDRIIDPAAVGRLCTSLEEVESAIVDFKKLGYENFAAKALFALAGRGIRRVIKPAWIERMIANQGGVVIEPWFERLFDFSAQYQVTSDGITLKGYTQLLNDDSGHFLGSVANASFSRQVPHELRRFLLEADGDRRGWARVIFEDTVPELLAEHLVERSFTGALGIDAFVYRDTDGQPRLRPIVEINPRYTMGRVALEMRRLAAPGRAIMFRIFSTRDLAKGDASFQSIARDITTRHPIEKSRTGTEEKIRNGALLANDPATATGFLGVLFIGDAVASETGG